jgi:hypothetical protein
MANAIAAANINHNLVTEEFWTCGRYNTANGELLEYSCASPAGIGGENRCGDEGPWS